MIFLIFIIADIIHALDIWKPKLIMAFPDHIRRIQQSEWDKAMNIQTRNHCFSISTDRIRRTSYCFTQSPCCQEAIDLRCSRQSLHHHTERRRGGETELHPFLKQEGEWYSPTIACTHTNVHSLGVAAYSVLTWVSLLYYFHISFMWDVSFPLCERYDGNLTIPSLEEDSFNYHYQHWLTFKTHNEVCFI